jgi:hypothetical protein
MDSESQIKVDGEYCGMHARILLTVLRSYPKDDLFDCSITITTNSWSFSSEICFSSVKLKAFKEQVCSMVETNEGAASLESYSEESEIRLFVVNKSSGRIVIEGLIARPAPAVDERLYNKPARLAGYTPCGGFLSFGGFETDQSYLRDTLVMITRVLNPVVQS